MGSCGSGVLMSAMCREAHVKVAIAGIRDIFPGKMKLVPLEQRVDTLTSAIIEVCCIFCGQDPIQLIRGSGDRKVCG